MKHKLSIKGFKCYKDASLELNNLTILIGANGTGKSSIIQSLLLLKYAIMHAVDGKLKIPMHNMLGIDFGQFESIINKEYNDDSPAALQSIQIKLDDLCVDIPISLDISNTHYVDANLTYEQFDSILRTNLHYLDAERLGPRYAVEYKGDEDDSCGIHGDNTAYIWLKYQHKEVAENKRLYGDINGKFSRQLDLWIDYLFDGVKLSVVTLHDRALQVQLAGNNQLTNLNIGFGISYALPILVEGLILEKNDTLIVENPEAHLQPKAQTQIGYFLAQMADAGLRVVVETHSEHVLEGIIAYKKSKEGLIGDDFCSLYMVYRERGSDEPKIELKNLENKNIQGTDFPSDFFAYTADTLLKEKSETSKMLDNFGL